MVYFTMVAKGPLLRCIMGYFTMVGRKTFLLLGTIVLVHYGTFHMVARKTMQLLGTVVTMHYGIFYYGC